MPDQRAVIEVDHVSKSYRGHAYREWLLHDLARRMTRSQPPRPLRWALRDVSFRVERGTSLGVIGHNGAGKSTLLKMIAGIARPTSGKVAVRGRISTQLGLGLGFNPLLTGRENIFLEGTIFGLSNRDIRARMDGIVEFSGLSGSVDQPLWTYSTGMSSRLGFAVAAHVDFETLLLDEALSAGDAAFRERCNEALQRFRDDGRTLVIVSHGMASIRDLCDRVLWLDHGTVLGEGTPAEMADAYEAASGVTSKRAKATSAEL
jgi:ABC-type polysaccharide/polyol phosphate transport system ATPase subunit